MIPVADATSRRSRRRRSALRLARLRTAQGEMAVAESPGRGPAVLMIHGNSACKECFLPQMTGEMGRRYRMIAIDLPGHGGSDDARDPARGYTMPGYAALVLELLDRLGVDRAAVVGWSLGGHVGLELLQSFRGLAGLMIIGTPPVGRGLDAVSEGFLPGPEIDYAGRENFTAREAAHYARQLYGRGAPLTPDLVAAVRRTDGRARRIMVEAFLAGRCADQRALAETDPRPLAVVSGAAEPFVDNAYLECLSYRNLWRRQVRILDGLGHAPFFEDPGCFNPILKRFLKEVLGTPVRPRRSPLEEMVGAAGFEPTTP